jgi:hypothetical protein
VALNLDTEVESKALKSWLKRGKAALGERLSRIQCTTLATQPPFE